MLDGLSLRELLQTDLGLAFVLVLVFSFGKLYADMQNKVGALESRIESLEAEFGKIKDFFFGKAAGGKK